LGVCEALGSNTFHCKKDPTALEGAPCDADNDGCTVGDACLDGTWDANGNGIYAEPEDEADHETELAVGRAPVATVTEAATFVAKYASIVVLSDLRGENLFPLLLERLNIYTDPQRPMKTDAKIYEFNNPTAKSPVLVTCNFSLTYFVVSGEIESSRQPAYLAVVDTDGLSVLTAWAAGKFVGDAIGPFIQKQGIAEKLEKPTLILPGYTAVISGDVEEELGDSWDVKIGPREASAITPYLKENYGQ
jgi:acetyl-CoA decarbonylase/synthase complex subunit gamma